MHDRYKDSWYESVVFKENAITLNADGSSKTVPQGSRPLDIAKSIGPRLADDAAAYVARARTLSWAARDSGPDCPA